MVSRDIDWSGVERVLVIRLRSIGDTVLTTPSLIALRRSVPDARIDILLEDWVAPLLEGSPYVDNVIPIGGSASERLSTAWRLRKRRYDVVINLHGGTTATLLTAATGARHRIGFAGYQYSFLHNHAYPPAVEFWKTDIAHSAQQQLALLGYAGLTVEDRPKSLLTVTADAAASIEKRLEYSGLGSPNSPFALVHPAAAFASKQWATDKFARTAEYLAGMGIGTVAVAAKTESQILQDLKNGSKVPITTFDDLALPEITALAARARLFVGNDSGVAHIAAAVGTPSIVIFGSSNRGHWRPWTDAPHEVVFNELPCQPCPGYVCAEFGDPKCILDLSTEKVVGAIERLLLTMSA